MRSSQAACGERTVEPAESLAEVGGWSLWQPQSWLCDFLQKAQHPGGSGKTGRRTVRSVGGSVAKSANCEVAQKGAGKWFR